MIKRINKYLNKQLKRFWWWLRGIKYVTVGPLPGKVGCVYLPNGTKIWIKEAQDVPLKGVIDEWVSYRGVKFLKEKEYKRISRAHTSPGARNLRKPSRQTNLRPCGGVGCGLKFSSLWPEIPCAGAQLAVCDGTR